jgi:hypothetical protein
MAILIISIVLMYIIGCYFIGFCVATSIYVFYPDKIHKFKGKDDSSGRRTCGVCGVYDSLYHDEDRRSFVAWSPFTVPFYSTICIIKESFKWISDTGPQNIAKYIRSSFLSNLKGEK